MIPTSFVDLLTGGRDLGVERAHVLVAVVAVGRDEGLARVVAVGVIPYPPGIPIVMPGENVGTADGPWITYLRTMQEYGHQFPGFAKEERYRSGHADG